MNREYYQDINYKPMLFYMVFGASGDELEVSREKHHVTEFPEGLAIHSLTRDHDGDYIDSFFGGSLGEILECTDSKLYAECKAAEKCVVITGEVINDSSLEYMVNVAGIIEAFIDKGACGVLDLLTFSLFSPAKWTEKFFEKEINAQDYVIILVSEEKRKCWLHTRGMSEFGRPDISIRNVEQENIEDFKQIIDQLIYYGGQGAFFNGKVKLHTFAGKAFLVEPRFIEDFDNDDFNNAYYEVEVLEEIGK